MFAVVQEGPRPVFMSDAHMDGGGSNSSSLVRMTNWCWSTMATVGISRSKEVERSAHVGSIVSRRDTILAKVGAVGEG